MAKLTLNQVASILECGSETIRRAVQDGRLTPINRDTRKAGTAYIFDADEILQLPQPGEYLTTSRVYEVLRDEGLLKDTDTPSGRLMVRRLVSAGRIKKTQSVLNDFYLISPADLQDYIDKNKSNEQRSTV